MLFSRKTQSPIGLDISDLSLKLIQLNKTRNKINIQAISQINLAPGIIENGEIKNQQEVVSAVNKLVSRPRYGKITSTDVVACLPETKTFVKLVSLETGANSLADMVGPEIEKHVPFKINELYYDWQVIGKRKDIQTVLVAAAPKNVINDYTSMINASKLSVRALEIEAIPICRCLLAEESSDSVSDNAGNYGIIDIGAKRTSMIFYSKNTVLFTVSIPISGDAITGQIAQTLEIDREQAEKAKLICGLDESKAQGVIKKILSDMIDNLTTKIKQAVTYYNVHFPEHGKLNQIIFCGGGANIRGLDAIIKQVISTEVSAGNIFTNTHQNLAKNFTETHKILDNFLSEKPDKKNAKTLSMTQDNSLAFTTAMGLALRGIFIHDV